MLLFDEVRIAICQWLAVVCQQSLKRPEQAFAELEAFMRECTGRGQMHPPKARLEYQACPATAPEAAAVSRPAMLIDTARFDAAIDEEQPVANPYTVGARALVVIRYRREQ